MTLSPSLHANREMIQLEIRIGMKQMSDRNQVEKSSNNQPLDPGINFMFKAVIIAVEISGIKLNIKLIK